MPRGVLPAYMLQGYLPWPESTVMDRLQTGVVEPKPSKVGARRHPRPAPWPKPSKVGVRRSPGPSSWPKPSKVGSSSAYKGVLPRRRGKRETSRGRPMGVPSRGRVGKWEPRRLLGPGAPAGRGWDVAEAAGPGRPGRRRWNAVCSIGGSGTGAHAALTALTAMVGPFQSHLLDWTAICVHQRRTHGKDRRAERNLP